MSTSTELRRQEVLRAIVADFIASREPVGSKSLLERHQLNVSSATIRNDMAVLEKEGYIAQQHASSGRIPTEKGYRQFVDRIHELTPLSAPERKAIVSFLEDGVDLEDVLRRSVQLLAQLTRQAAIVQLPTLSISRVKHCEVVALSPTRLLLVLITDTGRVDQRNVVLEDPIDDDHTRQLRDLLNRELSGKTLADASASLAALAEASGPSPREIPETLRTPLVRATTTLIETLVERPSDRFIVAGAANLTKQQAEFSRGLATVLDALEEQVTVLRLLANVPELGNVTVLIGEENEDDQFREASIVTSGYGSEGSMLGGMGVVGPTFMDYSATMSKVSAVARYVSRVVSQ